MFYSLTSINPNSTQHSTTSNNQLNTINPFSTFQSSSMSRNSLQNIQFQTSNFPSTTSRTKPHIDTTYTQLFTNPQILPPNPSNTPTYNPVPLSTLLNSAVSNPS